jgi:hypothetical protein
VTFTRTVIVSPVVGSPLESGMALREAYAGIWDYGPEDPVLLKLEPGVFDIGGDPLDLDRPGVFVEGSGRMASTIRGSGFVVLRISADTSLSHLSVANDGGDGLTAVAGHVDLVDILVTASRNSTANFASGVIYAASAVGRMKDVVVEVVNASGYAQGVNLVSSIEEPAFMMDGVDVHVTAERYAVGVQVRQSASLNEVCIDSSWSGLTVVATGAPPVVTLVSCQIGGPRGTAFSRRATARARSVSVAGRQDALPATL